MKENFLLVVAPLVAILVLLACIRITTYPPTAFLKSSMFVEKDSSCNTCPDFVSTADCTNSESPVLGGLDFVQYFTEFKFPNGTYDESQVGTIGSSSYSSVYEGYTFYFKSADNKKLFDETPGYYIPQYGGFCGWGVSGETCPNYPWDSDCLGPSGNWAHWTIQNNKLYFFLFDNAKQNFLTDPTSHVEFGDSRWSTWFSDDTIFDTTCYVTTNNGETHIGNSFPTPRGKPLN